MSDKATMLRETVEAFADLRTMFDGLTEEQASRVWLGVLGVRDIVIHIHWPVRRILTINLFAVIRVRGGHPRRHENQD